MIIFLLLAGCFAWISNKIYSHYYIQTEDAYVNANVVRIAPRVTGKVTQVYVSNNQYVKKGDALFDLDPESFQVALDEANAQLAVSKAELDKTSMIQQRTLALVKRKFLSQQDGDNVIANYKTALAKVAQAKARLEQAQLNLTYTKVLAPISGQISNMSLRAGDMVAINQALFALISDDLFWVDANFKETEMAAIKPGQSARIVTDLYPDHVFHGVVESISGSSGTAFSLLPAQNASGNWIKVAQRIPVRIRILNPNQNTPLRIGISAAATVHLS